MKPKIDLRELARLRDSGMSLREIERVTKVGKTTVIRMLLRFYEQKGKG
jgi:transposase-like protein